MNESVIPVNAIRNMYCVFCSVCIPYLRLLLPVPVSVINEPEGRIYKNYEIRATTQYLLRLGEERNWPFCRIIRASDSIIHVKKCRSGRETIKRKSQRKKIPVHLIETILVNLSITSTKTQPLPLGFPIHKLLRNEALLKTPAVLERDREERAAY